MNLFRLQNNVPDVYVNQSRDFQLFCRLYDCNLQGVKFDIDTIPYTLDTGKIKNTFLPLLATKLGFQSFKQFDDQTLRYILLGFPYVVKNKGSLLGIKQSVYIYLKTLHLITECLISIINKQTDQQKFVSGVEDYTIAIGIKSSIKDLSVLQEILKYILPPGYKYYFYFYTTQKTQINKVLYNHIVYVIYAQNRKNSMIKGNAQYIRIYSQPSDWYTSENYYLYEWQSDSMTKINNPKDAFQYYAYDIYIKITQDYRNNLITQADTTNVLGTGTVS